MKDFWEDLWENFVKPYLLVLILIGWICWLLVYSYLILVGELQWFDFMGLILIFFDVLITFFYQKSRLARLLRPIANSQGFFWILCCVITFSNLMHLEAVWSLYCYVLKKRGVVLALAFLIEGIHKYFTIPKS